MNEKLELVAVADLHIGANKFSADSDQWNAPLKEAVEYALAHRCAYFLIAGDAFHRRNPSIEEQWRLHEILWPLQVAGVRIIGVAGNHDYGATADSRPATQFMPGCWQYGSPALFDDGRLQVILLPWPRLCDYAPTSSGDIAADLAHAAEAVLGRLKALAHELDRERPAVLLGHAMVSYGFDGGLGEPAPVDPGLMLGKDVILPYDRLPQAVFMSLGHVHDPDTLGYIGSTQPTDWSEAGQPKRFRHLVYERADGFWQETARSIPFESTLRLLDVDGEFGSEREFTDYLQSVRLQEPCWAARAVITEASEGEKLDPLRLRQILADYAHRVEEVKVVSPVATAARIDASKIALASADPVVAFNLWMVEKKVPSQIGPAAESAFRDLVASAGGNSGSSYLVTPNTLS